MISFLTFGRTGEHFYRPRDGLLYLLLIEFLFNSCSDIPYMYIHIDCFISEIIYLGVSFTFLNATIRE